MKKYNTIGKLIFGFIFLAAPFAYSAQNQKPTNDNLLGKIVSQTNKSFIYFDILDYQRRDHIGVVVQLDLPNVEKSSYKMDFGYIPVERYYKAFHTEEKLNKKYTTDKVGKRGRPNRTDIEASGTMKNRKVVITMDAFDDDGDLAQRNVVTIQFTDMTTASVRYEAIRKKYRFSSFKVSADNTVSGLLIKRDGVGLYGDNRGWPLGRVISKKALFEAVKDTSTDALKKVCEVGCK